MIIGTLYAVAGVGIVLAGLRGVTHALTDTLVTRLRETILVRLERAPVAMASGMVATLLLQASAATVLLVMALAQRSVVTVETAVLLVLGASIGSAIKTWIFVLPTGLIAAVLVSFGSVGLVWTRGVSRRRTVRAVFSLGLIYLGWELAIRGLSPVLGDPRVVGLAASMDLSTVVGFATVLLAGMAAATWVQSSTAIVLLVFALAGQDALSVETSVALVLGANVGTTVMPLFASIEYGDATRVVATMHLVTKATGVLIASLFFNTFLGLALGTCDLLGITTVVGQVAMAHTLFNVVNSVVWAPLAPVVARKVIGPAAQRRSVPFLARSVRRMLAGLPEEAAGEIEQERDTSLRQSKMFVDALVAGLLEHGDVGPLRAPYDLRARVLGVQELIAEVVVKGERKLEVRFQNFLSELNTLEDLLDECIALTRRLEQESTRVRVLRAVRLEAPLTAYRQLLDGAWAARVHSDRPAPSRDAFTVIERDMYELIQHSGRVDEADWMELAHQVSLLQRIWSRVVDLVEVSERTETAAAKADSA